VKPELILPVVRDAIEYLPVLQQPALLVLHPDDAATVRAGIGEELDKGGWRVVEDHRSAAAAARSIRPATRSTPPPPRAGNA
jgi:flagellar biosynthesis/type III secretory pathway protein FliH